MYDLRVLFDYTYRDVPAARFVCGLCSDGENRCVDDVDCPGGQPDSSEATRRSRTGDLLIKTCQTVIC
jgi:hypothetical protein